MATACEVVETDCSSAQPSPRKVAYVVSRFPKLTETFVLFEILAVEKLGVQVEIYPLLRARNTASHPEGASLLKKFLELWKRPDTSAVMHAAAEPLVKRAHFMPLLSLSILWAQLCMLFSRPLRYLRMLWTVIRANLGSANYLLGGLAVFPKAVYFARHMQRAGVTHIHAHFANHPAAVAFVIHGLTDIPYSFTAHGSDFQVDQHMLKEKVQSADCVVTISNNNKRFIVGHSGEDFRERIQVIRCGVDTDLFRPPKSRRNGVNGRMTIVCTGTMYPVKGHAYLIEACRQLDVQGVDFVCHLIGDGPLKSQLVRQIEDAGLQEKVIFRGQLTREQIAAQLAESDVLVVPSVPTQSGRREGIPVVLMEAMSTGLPVVASDISGIPELISDGRNGLLVPPRDSRAITAAILRLRDNVPLRELLGRAGRQTICAEYNQQANAARLCELFH
ncbi:MAG: glycosyltransferase [Planctomycetes bacterium]|nr:glycosyltransferase [Planctomycetota bacterium]